MSSRALLDAPSRTAAPAAGRGLFRAFWRWHFYASFLVVPVLLVLASTGLIYLFRFQLEPLLHPDLMQVSAPTGMGAVPLEEQRAAVLERHPDLALVSVTEPRADDRPTTFTGTTAGGSVRDVFVDPYRGEVLGALDPDRTLSGMAVRLHGELMAGRYGDLVIELGACWALVMALTGYYLFWKGRGPRRRGPRLRRTHAGVGAFVGVGLLFLLVSGLPWTGVWGAQVQRLATSQDSSLWSADPGGISDPSSTLDESLPHTHDVPWAQGDTEVPHSTRTGTPLTLDQVVAAGVGQGLFHPMTIVLPSDDRGVFSILGPAFDAPTDEITVHVDQYGGQVVSTYGFDDYPLPAKVVSLGIGLHEGRSLGAWSFAGAALMCLAVLVSCVTGPVMWWRRRPAGGLGAPRGRLPLRTTPWLMAALVGLGVLLPVFGLSLLVVLVLDHLVVRRRPALRDRLGST